MQLDRIEVLEFLKRKSISHLYHANTVKTACTFLRSGGLLSRGAVESQGLQQTYQPSDDKDKQFDVWNDIFLDDCDLHARKKDRNFYGPVLFKFKIEILQSFDLPEIWITKDNPVRWREDLSMADRYFQTQDELNKDYGKGTFGQMITLRGTQDPLVFQPYLDEILLDNPRIIINQVNYFEEAKKALEDAGEFSVSTRRCFSCKCNGTYSELASERKSHILDTLFLP